MAPVVVHLHELYPSVPVSGLAALEVVDPGLHSGSFLAVIVNLLDTHQQLSGEASMLAPWLQIVVTTQLDMEWKVAAANVTVTNTQWVESWALAVVSVSSHQ